MSAAYTQLIEHRVVAAANVALREGQVKLPRGIKSASVESNWVPEAARTPRTPTLVPRSVLRSVGVTPDRTGDQPGSDQSVPLRRPHACSGVRSCVAAAACGGDDPK
jgi:hypothetical protein